MLTKKRIDADTLNKEMFDNVLFFSLAEWGACGVPGEMIVINKEPAAYSMQSVFGDVDYREVEKLFPILGQCRFKIFGYDSEVPDGWHYVNLGLGNHLIVADEIYDEFQRLTKDCKEIYEYYAAWQDAAQEAAGLPDIREGDEYV